MKTYGKKEKVFSVQTKIVRKGSITKNSKKKF
jgi:hypothetical protein